MMDGKDSVFVFKYGEEGAHILHILHIFLHILHIPEYFAYLTACYTLPEKTRSNLYAVKRHNMSTATLQETAFHRSRGCKPE